MLNSTSTWTAQLPKKSHPLPATGPEMVCKTRLCSPSLWQGALFGFLRLFCVPDSLIACASPKVGYAEKQTWGRCHDTWNPWGNPCTARPRCATFGTYFRETIPDFFFVPMQTVDQVQGELSGNSPDQGVGHIVQTRVPHALMSSRPLMVVLYHTCVLTSDHIL